MGWFSRPVKLHREVDDETNQEYMWVSEIGDEIMSVKFTGDMAEFVDKHLGVAA